MNGLTFTMPVCVRIDLVRALLSKASMTPKDLREDYQLNQPNRQTELFAYFPVPVASFNSTSSPLKMAGINSVCAFVGCLILGKARCKADAIGARMPIDSNVGGLTNGGEL